MYVLNITDDYEKVNNCTDNENDDIEITFKDSF